MGQRRLIIGSVTGFRVMAISYACAGGVIKVIEIGCLSIGGDGGSLIYLAIQLAGATSANEAGKEEKDNDKGDDTSDREDCGNCTCVVKETETIVSRSPEKFRKLLQNCVFHGFVADVSEKRRIFRARINPEVDARETLRATALREKPVSKTSHHAGIIIGWDDRGYTHLVDDLLDGGSVGVNAGTVTTEVCVKTWPFEVWTTKETLEVKDGFEEEEEEEEEEVFVELVDEGAALEVLDVAALEDALEEGELLTELEELAGGVDVVSTVETEADVGVDEEVGALGSGELTGVAAGP